MVVYIYLYILRHKIFTCKRRTPDTQQAGKLATTDTQGQQAQQHRRHRGNCERTHIEHTQTHTTGTTHRQRRHNDRGYSSTQEAGVTQTHKAHTEAHTGHQGSYTREAHTSTTHAGTTTDKGHRHNQQGSKANTQSATRTHRHSSTVGTEHKQARTHPCPTPSRPPCTVAEDAPHHHAPITITCLSTTQSVHITHTHFSDVLALHVGCEPLGAYTVFPQPHISRQWLVHHRSSGAVVR
jgi:hypothetical protein